MQNIEDDIAYPFDLQDGEKQLFLYHDIKVKIIGQNNTEVSLEPIAGRILITNQRLYWFSQQKEQNQLSEKDNQFIESIKNKHGQKQESFILLNQDGKSFMFEYYYVLSHGLQNDTFLCILGEQEDESDIIGEDDRTGLEDLINQNNIKHIVNFERGKYKIEFNVSNLTKDIQEDLFNNFTEFCISQNNQE